MHNYVNQTNSYYAPISNTQSNITTFDESSVDLMGIDDYPDNNISVNNNNSMNDTLQSTNNNLANNNFASHNFVGEALVDNIFFGGQNSVNNNLDAQNNSYNNLTRDQLILIAIQLQNIVNQLLN
ncbi:12454_t:CDS:2 [Entrophospora sp. SA101]|nr:12454_t:CDS:2 [Entrophospora sp. SA101]